MDVLPLRVKDHAAAVPESSFHVDSFSAEKRLQRPKPQRTQIPGDDPVKVGWHRPQILQMGLYGVKRSGG